MSYCTEVIKKCDEKPTIWQRCKTWMKSPASVGIGTLMVCGLVSRSLKHTPAAIGASITISAVVTAFVDQKKKEKDIWLRNQSPCTTIFDAYRFQVSPLCYKLPRQKPLIFYNNEPKKPEPEDPWMKNIPYDNVPKPNCCKKVPPPADKEAMQSETYGHKPKGGKCPV